MVTGERNAPTLNAMRSPRLQLPLGWAGAGAAASSGRGAGEANVWTFAVAAGRLASPALVCRGWPGRRHACSHESLQA